MSGIFVDRQPAVDQFRAIIQPDARQWILIVGGVGGIGKTKVVSQLMSIELPDVNRVHLSFASPNLKQDPLAVLDTLEHSLADQLEGNEAYQKYKDRRQSMPEAMERDRVVCITQIKVETGGTLTARDINQKVTVDLSKALYERKLRLRNDLTREFLQVVGSFLAHHLQVRIVVFADDFESLKTLGDDGKEYAGWFLHQLLGGIYRLASGQLRLIVSDVDGLRWLATTQEGEKASCGLAPLSQLDVYDYLHQRSIRPELHQAIFDLTQGHPLCMALAADLCYLDCRLTSQDIKGLTLDKFDSEALAYRLFQGIIEHTSDRAMQRLLQYGPVFRVLDDTVVQQILAPELGQPGQAKEWSRLRDTLKGLSVMEETGDLSFKPALRNRHLEALRKIPNDPVYRSINLRAVSLYQAKAQQAQPVPTRRAYQREALYYRFNLEPSRSRRDWQRMADEAIADLDYPGMSALLDQARGMDWGWFSQDTRDIDRGIIKEYESRYYSLTGRSAEAQASHAEAQRLVEAFRQLPPPIIVTHPVPPIQPVPEPVPITRPGGVGAERSSGQLIGQILFSLFSAIWYGITRVGTWLFVFVRYVGRHLSALVGSVIHYLTSPLRRLERYRDRLRHIAQRLEQVHGQVVNDLIPRVARVRVEAEELQNSIADRTLPQLNHMAEASQRLANAVRYALENRDEFGRVSSRDLAEVSDSVRNHRLACGQFNQEIARFRKQHDRFNRIVQEASQLNVHLNEELQAHNQECSQLGQEAEQLDQESQAAGRLGPDEVRYANQLTDEIRAYCQQHEIANMHLLDALEQHRVAKSQAYDALNDLAIAINSQNAAVGRSNEFIKQLDGMVLTSTEGESITITVETGQA